MHQVLILILGLLLSSLSALVVVLRSILVRVLVAILVVAETELLLDQKATVLLTKLNLHVLEVSPLLQDLHGLDVLDCSQLLSVVLVTAKRVEVDLLAQVFVLVLHKLHDVDDLLTAKDLVIVHSSDGVEDGPHDLWVVDSAVVVSNVEAEDDLVEP